MSDQKHKKASPFLGLRLLVITALVLVMGSFTSIAAAAPVESLLARDDLLPPAQEGADEDEDEDEDEADDVPIGLRAFDPVAAAEDMRVLFEETTFVQLLWEEDYYAATACAGVGLSNIQPSPEGPIVLIPNAGDLSLSGSNVSVRMDPDGTITFIPRVQGQMIRVPIAVGDKQAGEEVLSLSLDEGRQLMEAGLLVWTAKDQGPQGTGHGLNGHIANCDPRYDDEQFKEWAGIDDDDNNEEDNGD